MVGGAVVENKNGLVGIFVGGFLQFLFFDGVCGELAEDQHGIAVDESFVVWRVWNTEFFANYFKSFRRRHLLHSAKGVTAEQIMIGIHKQFIRRIFGKERRKHRLPIMAVCLHVKQVGNVSHVPYCIDFFLLEDFQRGLRLLETFGIFRPMRVAEEADAHGGALRRRSGGACPRSIR